MVDTHSALTRTRSERNQAWRRVYSTALILAIVAVVTLISVVVLSSDAASRGDIIGRTVRMFVTLFIPASIMIAYWFIVQRQLRSAKSDLQTRFASGQDLIARVSHQLRDQLTVIYGFSEALLDSDMSDHTEVRDVVTIINAEALDLSRIVDDLVSAAELETGEFSVSFSSFDPSVEVERVVLPLRRRGHEISVDCWSGSAVSDPIRFRQIVRTLLSNATQHGGPTIGFVGELSNDSFLCTVVDDGDGMSTALEGQFFGSATDEPKSVSDVEGTGLGLAVSHAIAHQLGGRVTYERSSELTMVTMILPTKGWSNGPSDADTPDDVKESEDDLHDENEGEDQSDNDQQEGDSEDIIVVDVEASETDWLISFDDKDDHKTVTVDNDPGIEDDDEEPPSGEGNTEGRAEDIDANVESAAGS